MSLQAKELPKISFAAFDFSRPRNFINLKYCETSTAYENSNTDRATFLTDPFQKLFKKQ